MKQKHLTAILMAEILVIFIVTALFKFIGDKTLAALAASVVFISLGVFANVLALRWPRFLLSATFWLVQVHLFFSSIPLLVTRWIHLEEGFDQLTIFGIPGPQFHKVATMIYAALIVATTIDIIRVRRRGAWLL
jgi:hypothetical protein